MWIGFDNPAAPLVALVPSHIFNSSQVMREWKENQMLETQQPNTRRQRRYGNEEAGNKLDRLLSVSQTKKILGLSHPTVRRLIQKGLLDAVHLSARCLRIRESSIKKLTGVA